MTNYIFFSKGHDGCLVQPGIITKNMNIKEIKELYITKIGTKKNIENEKYIYDNLPKEYDNIFYNKECYIGNFNLNDYLFDDKTISRIKEKERKNINYDRFITIRLFNGVNISNIITKNVIIKKIDVYNLLKSLKKLYKCIESLNEKYGIFHRDITNHNILYDINTNKINLVDFVQSKIYLDKKRPSHLPYKDVDDMISVINSVIIFSRDEFKVTEIHSIKKIDDLNNVLHIWKKTLYTF